MNIHEVKYKKNINLKIYLRWACSGEKLHSLNRFISFSDAVADSEFEANTQQKSVHAARKETFCSVISKRIPHQEPPLLPFL